MVHEQGGRHRLGELGRRVGLDPHAALLQHHVALGRHDGVVEDEAAHAVGLERHHGAEVVAGDPLEIGGVVVAGEGVLLAAEPRDRLREGTDRVPLGPLEHQVLEEVGDARLAERIIGRAVAIPDHVGDDGSPVIGDHHHVEAVVEGEGRHLRSARLGTPERRGLAPTGAAAEGRTRTRREEGGRRLPEQVHSAFLLPAPSTAVSTSGRARGSRPSRSPARQEPVPGRSSHVATPSRRCNGDTATVVTAAPAAGCRTRDRIPRARGWHC